MLLDGIHNNYNIILSDSRFYLNPMENVDIFLLADNQPILLFQATSSDKPFCGL